MKHIKTAVPEKELELLEEVHRIEEEIDLFLERRKRETDLIIRNANQEAENFRAQAVREALEEKDRLRGQFVRDAEEEAERILGAGTEAVKEDAAHLDQMRTLFIEKIMEFLCGRDQ